MDDEVAGAVHGGALPGSTTVVESSCSTMADSRAALAARASRA
jgi:hypothetical protein